jgi:dTDP-4-amino-4,6-dideoxygalactose transaminase
MAPRTLAPAGTVIRPGELLAWLLGATFTRGEANTLLSLLHDTYGGASDIFLLSSGRAAMTIILRETAALSDGRDEVIVPAYTCYSVAASAVRAGLKVRPVDVDPATLDYRPEALERVVTDRVSAIVTANLYGIPNDLPRWETFARERSITLVDDAAQAMHARIDGRYAGTFGDAGIFSFDKGKNVTTIQGGVLLSRNRSLSQRISEHLSLVPPAPAGRVASETAKLVLYTLLLRPNAYWLPNRLLTLGETPFETDYPTHLYSPRLALMATRLLRRIDGITSERVTRAQQIRALLPISVSISLPRTDRGDPVFLRFPIVFSRRETRNRALSALEKAGIGATASYPRALIDVPQIKPHLAPATEDTPGARAIADGILTLPTHSFVAEHDIRRMADILAGVLAAAERT